MEKITIICDVKDRIDKILHNFLKKKGYSRQKIKEFIEKELVLLNNELVLRASTKVSVGDKVEISLPQEEGILPVEGDIDVVYEDDYLIVINKPYNLTTHPAPSCKEPTLVNILIKKYPELKELDNERPGIVHRLDKDTSGLMIIAKNREVQEKLKLMFQKKEIKKKYLALVYGILKEEQGEINVLMDRDQKTKIKMRVYSRFGRESITRYRVIKTFSDYNVSLVEADLLTGRTHQIRVHFSYIGHPILGDNLYVKVQKIENPIIEKLVKRQMLHSWELEFIHPVTKRKLHFKAPVPDDFYRVLLYVLKKRPMVVAVTGGVGCGKSKVSELLAKGGYPLWSADKAVEELYKCGAAGFELIKLNFGDEYIDYERGCLNKRKLFETMSQDKYFRHEVEKIIHPLVYAHMMEFGQKNRTKNMIILEIPLLVEAGWTKEESRHVFDVIVGIFCAEKIRDKRLKEIRGWGIEQIKETVKWQVSQKQRLAECDIIIDNSGSLDELEGKVTSLKKILKRLRIKKLYNNLKELENLGVIFDFEKEKLKTFN